jgi:uncharacterized protein (TIGR03435 family)
VSEIRQPSPDYASIAQPSSGSGHDVAKAFDARAGAIDGDPTFAAAPGADIDRKALAFEVVSIHEDKAGSSMQNLQNGPTPDGYRLRNGPLLMVIQTAYVPSEGTLAFRPNQIKGLPGWASSSVLYNIDAKVFEADLPSWQNRALQPEMLRSMLQAMLADRFKLVARREMRVVPIYTLVLGRKHPKFKPSEGATLAEIQQKHPNAFRLSAGTIVASGPNPGQQWLFGATMQDLGRFLSNLAGRPVKDETGLPGRYDLTYQVELRPPPQENGAPAPITREFFSSQISTIVEEQLGLKLKAENGPVEMLVIDHVEQPSEN